MLSELPLSLVNSSLKKVAEKVGDVHCARAASHGFRRGAACDMARLGRPLSEILIGGDWRSSAFRTYLESVQDDLNSRSIVQLLGDVSASDNEDD